MEAINRAERNTSIISFVAVYLIIIAIPVFMAFFAGTRRSSGVGSTKAVKEQELLTIRMSTLEQSVNEMRTHDNSRAASAGSPENWAAWLSTAESQNIKFKQDIDAFRHSKEFTDARSKIRLSACAYLDKMYEMRNLYITNLKTRQGERRETASIEQLQADKQQLQNEKQQLQNTINTQNAILAQKPAGGGGGGGGGAQDNQALTELKWQLRFEDADCKKAQADMLAAYKADVTRKKLYSTAKVNFQQIAQLARTSFALQRQATAKVREIDQTLSQL